MAEVITGRRTRTALVLATLLALQVPQLLPATVGASGATTVDATTSDAPTTDARTADASGPDAPATRLPSDFTPDAPTVEAATPLTVLYQGRLTDGSGTPVPGPVTLQVALYAVAIGGTPLWSETHPNVLLTTDGVYSVLLGSLTPFPVNAWSDVDRWIGTTVNGDAELAPRMRVASVPFAIEANRLNGKRSTDFDAFGAADIAAAGVQAQLKGSDATPPNQGSNQVHWNNLYGLPDGFVDGSDDIGVGVIDHGQLQGLGDNDHPQYLLGAAAATGDGNPPNLGSNRVHWDNLSAVPQPLVDGAIPSAWLAAGVIDSVRLGDAQVLSRHLQPGLIGPAQLSAGAVGTEQVADATLTGEDIANSTLSGDDLLNGTVTGADIQDGTLSGADIANGTITGGDLAPSSISGTLLQDGSVVAAKIFDEAVTTSKLAPGAVTADKLAPGSVSGAALQDNSVTGNAIADETVSDAAMVDSPGIEFMNLPGFADSVVSSIGQTIASITLDVPGPGWIQASGVAQVFILHDAGEASRCTIALSTVTGDVPEANSCLLGLPGSLPSELYSFPAQVTAVFQVASAGSVTIHLTAKKGVQVRQPSLHNVRLSGIYLPRRY